MTTRRLASGRYEVETERGTYTVEKVSKWDGAERTVWHITAPGDTEAHDAADTLQEAKEMIGRWGA